MNLLNLMPLLGQAQAPASSATTEDPRAAMLKTVSMFVLMGLVFYFVLIRPQQKKQKEHTQMLKTVRPGDRIVTSGGIVAVVVTVKEKTLSVRSADAKFEITKAAIAEITERSGETTES